MLRQPSFIEEHERRQESERQEEEAQAAITRKEEVTSFPNVYILLLREQ